MAESSSSVIHVGVQQAADVLETDNEIIVLDVRTPWEYRRGHLNGAVNINYLSLGFRSKIADLDPEATYLVHCKSGHRSERALKSLLKAGIANLIHLDGGIDAWRTAGQSVTRSRSTD